MIELKTLANDLQTKLNAINSNAQFKIYADIGEFKHSYRATEKVNRPLQNNDTVAVDYPTNIFEYPINGILEVLGTDIIPIRGLQIATMSTQLNLVLDTELLGKDENGNYIEVEQVRSILDGYVLSNQGVPTQVVQNNVEYEVVTTFGGITVGIASQLSPIGEVLPISLSVIYTFVENGVSSNSIKLLLNGLEIPSNNVSIARVRTSETNPYNTKLVTNTVVLANGISFNIVLPLLRNDLGDYLYNDIMVGEQNSAQVFSVIKGERQDNYLTIFGDASANLENGKNVGLTINLVEGQADLLNYGDNWTTQTNTVADNQTVILDIETESPSYFCVVFWGDGTNSFVSSGDTIQHTYANEGTYTVHQFLLEASNGEQQ